VADPVGHAAGLRGDRAAARPRAAAGRVQWVRSRRWRNADSDGLRLV